MTVTVTVLLPCHWFVPKKEVVAVVAVPISYLWFISHLQDPFAWDLWVEVGVDCRRDMMDFLKMMEMF